MVGRRQLTSNGADAEHKLRNDVETGLPRNRLNRFRDAANRGLIDKRRADLKRELMEGIDHNFMQGYRKSDDELSDIKNKKLRKFYEDQNERLDDWLEVDTLVMAMAEGILDSMNPDADGDGIRERSGALQEAEEQIDQLLPKDYLEKRLKSERQAQWAININVIANIILLAAKIFAAFYSSSLSLLASLVDSALDLLCTTIVWTTSRLVSWRLTSLRKRFPVGRRRLEPLGILVFSIIMIISFVQILQESVKKLLPPASTKMSEFPPVAIGAMVATIVVKGIIWFGCIPIKTTQVQALAQDCKTDVIFNTISLLFPVIGIQTGVWWLDPVGAGLLSLFIIYDWGATSFENITRLSGSAADEKLLKKLTFLSYRFSPIVKGFKSIKAYHAGDGIWVEIDLLLDEKTPLSRTHDISETLQYCCEGLREVDRAFVTVDYTTLGPTGHSSE